MVRTIHQGEVKKYYNRYMAGELVPANWVNETDYDPKIE